MRIEDIIDYLNTHIEEKRKALGLTQFMSHLVLHKLIQDHATFKAYKTYTYTIWCVSRGTKQKILEVNYMDRVPSGQEETMNKSMSEKLILLILDWVGSESYDKVIKGEI